MLEKTSGRRRCQVQTPIVLISVLLLMVTSCVRIQAQDSTTRNEFWPEIDVFIHIKPKIRLYLMGTISKSVEDGEIRNAQSYEAQVGVHVDYIPTNKAILRVGYRYGRAVGANDDGFREHRLITEQTLRKLLPGDFLLSDRNREDFRFINGDFSFRYRNRVTLEREIPIFKGRHVTPYVSGEIFYDTRYNVWNRNRMAVGFQHTLKAGPLQKMLLHRRQVVLDIYIMKQNDSRAETQHVKALGAALILYF